MQKLFIVRESGSIYIDEVHNFIGEKGKIISVTANIIAGNKQAG